MTLREYRFYIRRRYGGAIETITIKAHDSYEAVSELPDDLVYWDFAGSQDCEKELS